MSAELGAITAAALMPLLTVQERVVENEENPQTSDARPVVDLALKYSALAHHHLNHLECTPFGPISANLDAITTAGLMPLLTVQERVVENEGNPQTSDARPVMDLALKYFALARHHLNHLECTSFGLMPADLGAIIAATRHRYLLCSSVENI